MSSLEDDVDFADSSGEFDNMDTDELDASYSLDWSLEAANNDDGMYLLCRPCNVILSRSLHVLILLSRELLTGKEEVG